ncbi:unnamed protein product [Sphenostylis stenocarpa]|uniref:Uncharacterized protein n=1 Tax=Sphenostylis stenocarpa TaxID=92480 RepID=A0AA86SWS9_9FABA|nr:unnamed protein product [Sphenostylis stenocarpa]
MGKHLSRRSGPDEERGDAHVDPTAASVFKFVLTAPCVEESDWLRLPRKQENRQRIRSGYGPRPVPIPNHDRANCLYLKRN